MAFSDQYAPAREETAENHHGRDAIGVPESGRNFANQIARGGFTAAFSIQCMVAIGTTTLRLSTEDA